MKIFKRQFKIFQALKFKLLFAWVFECLRCYNGDTLRSKKWPDMAAQPQHQFSGSRKFFFQQVLIVVGIFTTVINKEMHPTSPYIWLCVHDNFVIDVMSKTVIDFIDVYVNRNRV